MTISSKDNPPLVGMKIFYPNADRYGEIVEITKSAIYYADKTNFVFNTTLEYWDDGYYKILKMPANYKIPKANKKSRLSFI